MANIGKILKSKDTPKEKALKLAQKLKSDKNSSGELIAFYRAATDAEKGTCLAALAQITKQDPKFVEPYLDFVIDQIGYKAPRVKWEASEVVANATRVFPDKAAKAIPNLIENTKDEGTVVRWSSAYGLTEIAKANPKTRKELIPLFGKMVYREKQNGVKNIYVKALKALGENK